MFQPFIYASHGPDSAQPYSALAQPCTMALSIAKYVLL
ncbi:hypothetical protein GFS31_11560 [Leptolyngbya sp. BL0902]|nr:hypothetical protein GFS31_11560 [Leptolyngbya sp. BL0902]